MKTFLARAVLYALLVGVGVLVASAQLNQAPKGKDDRAAQEVRRLNAEEVEAFVHNDPEAMARLWSDDFVVITNPLNKFINKQQFWGWSHPASWRSLPTTGRSSISGSMAIP